MKITYPLVIAACMAHCPSFAGSERLFDVSVTSDIVTLSEMTVSAKKIVEPSHKIELSDLTIRQLERYFEDESRMHSIRKLRYSDPSKEFLTPSIAEDVQFRPLSPVSSDIAARLAGGFRMWNTTYFYVNTKGKLSYDVDASTKLSFGPMPHRSLGLEYTHKF